MTGVSSFPLAWPVGWPRTSDGKRERGYQFKKVGSDGYRDKFVSFADARDGLFDELRRLSATSPVVSTNHPTNRYGIPTESKKRVADEGVAVYFQLKGRPMVMASDKYDTAAANMRSLALAIEAMRQLERHGGGTMMERAFNGFPRAACAEVAARHPRRPARRHGRRDREGVPCQGQDHAPRRGRLGRGLPGAYGGAGEVAGWSVSKVISLLDYNPVIYTV